MVNKIKITITSIDREPSFLVDEYTSSREIEEYIKNRYGAQAPPKKGMQAKKHEWISQKSERTRDNSLYLEEEISQLREQIALQEREEKRLKQAIKNLNKCLVQAHTKIYYIDRTQNINWLDNVPSKEDIKSAKLKTEEILIRLKLEDIEK
ncbi:MAG: hypothetical protein M0R80_03975 [Proteobacteria bacterium]|nr:hypothetical protein [Pseudomonadota bacterium]